MAAKSKETLEKRMESLPFANYLVSITEGESYSKKLATVFKSFNLFKSILTKPYESLTSKEVQEYEFLFKSLERAAYNRVCSKHAKKANEIVGPFLSVGSFHIETEYMTVGEGKNEMQWGFKSTLFFNGKAIRGRDFESAEQMKASCSIIEDSFDPIFSYQLKWYDRSSLGRIAEAFNNLHIDATTGQPVCFHKIDDIVNLLNEKLNKWQSDKETYFAHHPLNICKAWVIYLSQNSNRPKFIKWFVSFIREELYLLQKEEESVPLVRFHDKKVIDLYLQ